MAAADQNPDREVGIATKKAAAAAGKHVSLAGEVDASSVHGPEPVVVVALKDF